MLMLVGGGGGGGLGFRLGKVENVGVEGYGVPAKLGRATGYPTYISVKLAIWKKNIHFVTRVFELI